MPPNERSKDSLSTLQTSQANKGQSERLVRRKSNTIYCKLKRISAVPFLFHSFWFCVFVVVVAAHKYSFPRISSFTHPSPFPFPYAISFFSQALFFSVTSQESTPLTSFPKSQDRAAQKTRPILLFLDRCFYSCYLLLSLFFSSRFSCPLIYTYTLVSSRASAYLHHFYLVLSEYGKNGDIPSRLVPPHVYIQFPHTLFPSPQTTSLRPPPPILAKAQDKGHHPPSSTHDSACSLHFSLPITTTQRHVFYALQVKHSSSSSSCLLAAAPARSDWASWLLSTVNWMASALGRVRR